MNNKRDKKVWNYEKLFIGPSMVFAEHMCGGYFMENIKIKKQATGNPYPQIVRNMVKPGVFSTYQGYLKYGLPQTLKGFPVLFTQYGVEKMIENSDTELANNNKAKKLISGMVGGKAQALFITPLQRCRSIIVTSNSSNPVKSVSEVIKREGLSTVMKGWQPTMMKRSMDWGVRFYAKGVAEDYFLSRKAPGNLSLTTGEKLASGMAAGLTGIVTIPFDTMVAMSQQYKEKKEGTFEIIKKNFKQHGTKIFTRGLTARLLHSSWHTMFMMGVGDIVFSMIKQRD